MIKSGVLDSLTSEERKLQEVREGGREGDEGREGGREVREGGREEGGEGGKGGREGGEVRREKEVMREGWEGEAKVKCRCKSALSDS